MARRCLSRGNIRAANSTTPSNTVLSFVLHGLLDPDVEAQHGQKHPSHLIWEQPKVSMPAAMGAVPTWCCRLVVMHSLQKGPWQQREMTGSWAPSMQMGHSPESSPTSFSSSCAFFSADSSA